MGSCKHILAHLDRGDGDFGMTLVLDSECPRCWEIVTAVYDTAMEVYRNFHTPCVPLWDRKLQALLDACRAAKEVERG